MLLTLQTYVFRELLKTFGLTVLALSALFTMGGGLYNVMKFEGVTATDLFRVLPMLLPVVITLTMPISALFAATMLYGRLSSDNEFVACRAAGINVHQLFVPAILLAVGVTIFSLFATSLVIPRFIRGIEHYARINIRDIAFHKIRQRGYVERVKDGNRYVLTAAAVRDVSDGALIEKGFDPPTFYRRYFWVDQPAFLWVDRDEAPRYYVVAEGALCQFDTDGGQVRATLHVRNARIVEFGASATVIGEQKIGPIPVPLPMPIKPGMVDIGTLLEWREQPWKSPEVAREIEFFLLRLRIYELYRQFAARLADGEALLLEDDFGRRHELRAAEVAPGETGPLLSGVTLVRTETEFDRPTRIEAPSATLRISKDLDGRLVCEIEMTRADGRAILEYTGRAADYDEPIRQDTFVTSKLPIPEALLRDLPTFPAPQIARGRPDTPLAAPLEEQLAGIHKEALKIERKATSLVHFRLSSAGSPLVTVLMGAVLGVIYRGSRTLAAFGLACIPFGIAALLILVGRSLIDHDHHSWLGPMVIWGGLIGVAVVDVVLLRLGVRR